MRDFSHLNTGQYSSFKMWVIAILSSMGIGGIIALFIFYFSITDIIIDREKDDLNLRYAELTKMMESIKGANLFIVSPLFLEKQIQLRFPEIETTIVTKQYPKTIKIFAKSYDVVLKIVYTKQGEKEEYLGYVSKNGIFFNNGNPDLFTIYDKDTKEEYLTPLDKVFLESEISEIREGKKLLEETIHRKIVSAELLKNAQEVHYLDEKGVKYWLFLGKEFSRQVKKLEYTLKERNIYARNLEYVDLRIGRKVIYKPQ